MGQSFPEVIGQVDGEYGLRPKPDAITFFTWGGAALAPGYDDKKAFGHSKAEQNAFSELTADGEIDRRVFKRRQTNSGWTNRCEFRLPETEGGGGHLCNRAIKVTSLGRRQGNFYETSLRDPGGRVLGYLEPRYPARRYRPVG